jgi:hypothetical protein
MHLQVRIDQLAARHRCGASSGTAPRENLLERLQRVSASRESAHLRPHRTAPLLHCAAVALKASPCQIEVARHHPRNDSGSKSSPSAVEPVTSLNRTVTVLRTSRTGVAARAAPHAVQKRASSGFCLPQFGHPATAKAYDGQRREDYPLKGPQLSAAVEARRRSAPRHRRARVAAAATCRRAAHA